MVEHFRPLGVFSPPYRPQGGDSAHFEKHWFSQTWWPLPALQKASCENSLYIPYTDLKVMSGFVNQPIGTSTKTKVSMYLFKRLTASSPNITACWQNGMHCDIMLGCCSSAINALQQKVSVCTNASATKLNLTINLTNIENIYQNFQ